MSSEELVAVIAAVMERIWVPEPYARRDLTYFSDSDLWSYRSVLWPGHTCTPCAHHENGLFQGSHLRMMFPYLQIVGEDEIWPLVHPNCALAGTLVQTIDGLKPIEDIQLGERVLTHRGRFRPVIQLHRNEYSGNIWRIGDSWLTGNHPVLTDRGWVAAEDLNNADSIIQVKFSNRSFLPSKVAESEDVPSLSAKILRLPNINVKFPAKTMPLSSVNFNGYLGTGNGEVDVVDVDGVLGNDLHPLPSEYVGNLGFERTYLSGCLNADGAVDKIRMASRHSSDAVMGCSSNVGALFKRHLRSSENLGFMVASMRNSRFNHNPAYSRSTNSEMAGDGKLRHSFIDVHADDVVDGQINSSHMTLAPLSNSDIEDYKGFVHNLSVAEDETYTIGDEHIIVHNCLCRMYRVSGMDLIWGYLGVDNLDWLLDREYD